MRSHLGVVARVGLVAALVVVLAGCDWTTFHGGAARTGFNAFETKIGVANVSTLTTAWTASESGLLSSDPVTGNGLVYVSGAAVPASDDDGFYAFSTTDQTNCSGTPLTCDPVWRAKALCLTGCDGPLQTNFGDPTVANGVVYVGDTDGNLYAFDASGTTNCSGTPRTCTPLWTATEGTLGISTSPAVANGVVYVATDDGTLYAFDAAGTTGCSGTPKTCAPLWTSNTGTNDFGASTPAVANGVVYVGLAKSTGSGALYAFDAAGVTGCSGTPKTCLPMWSSPIGDSFSTPAVSHGIVYIGTGTSTGGSHSPGQLFAFDAAGVVGCSGTPKTCLPRWTATVADGTLISSPAVAKGVVYIGSGDDKLYAFDATGSTNCSGTPKACLPLWTAATGDILFSSPAVANGVVYIASGDAHLYAFDAAGSTNCSGTPKACVPLWKASTGSETNWSPAVADGVVYIVGGDSRLYAFSLGSASTIR